MLEVDQMSQSIECCLGWYMNIKKIPQMDETYKSYLVKVIMNDNNVLFHWGMAGFDTDEEMKSAL